MTGIHPDLLIAASYRPYEQTQPVAVLLWLVVNLLSLAFEFNHWATRREAAKKADKGGLALLLTGTAAGAAVLVIAPTILPSMAIRPAPLSFGIGMAAYLAGFGMRRWSEMTLGRYFTFTVMTSHDQPVVTSGPYRFVRHPGYTGVWLVVLGAGFVAGNWAGLAGWTILVMLPLLYRIRVEESALVGALGDSYRSHAAPTSAWCRCSGRPGSAEYRMFADPRLGPLTSSRRTADRPAMSISPVSSMSGIAAAQSMFGVAAQAASGLTAANSGSGGGGTAEAVQVALLQKTLDMERSLVNILA